MAVPTGTVIHSVFVRSKCIYVILFHCWFFRKNSGYRVNSADMLEYETSWHVNFWNIDKYRWSRDGLKPNPSRCVRNEHWLLRNCMLNGVLLSLQRHSDIRDTHRAGETAPKLDGLFTCHLVPENMSVGKQTETVSQCLPLERRYVKAP